MCCSGSGIAVAVSGTSRQTLLLSCAHGRESCFYRATRPKNSVTVNFIRLIRCVETTKRRPEQMMIYQVIEKAGNMGIWTRDIKTGTSVNQARNTTAVALPLPPPTPSQTKTLYFPWLKGVVLRAAKRGAVCILLEKNVRPFIEIPGVGNGRGRNVLRFLPRPA